MPDAFAATSSLSGKIHRCRNANSLGSSDASSPCSARSLRSGHREIHPYPPPRGSSHILVGWLSNRGIQLRSGTRQEFRFPQFPKVLTTSATKLATKFDEEPRREGQTQLLRCSGFLPFTVHEISDLIATPFTRLMQSCLLYTSPSPRDQRGSRMPSSA